MNRTKYMTEGSYVAIACLCFGLKQNFQEKFLTPEYANVISYMVLEDLATGKIKGTQISGIPDSLNSHWKDIASDLIKQHKLGYELS